MRYRVYDPLDIIYNEVTHCSRCSCSLVMGLCENLDCKYYDFKEKEKEMSLNFMQAIARQEGFYVKGTLAERRNNPGNIEEGKFAQSHGALPSDGNRFAAWATPEEGFAAMSALLGTAYAGLTVAEAIAKWAPANENDTAQYVVNVCTWTGLSATSNLSAEDFSC